MCDYSLHTASTRDAKVGDKLESSGFMATITRGFRELGGDPNTAICLCPGTEVAFEKEVVYDRAFSLFGMAKVGSNVARFRHVNEFETNIHHDALEFSNGTIVLLTRLQPGQIATVLQLPANEKKPDGGAQSVTRSTRETIDA